MRHTSAPPPPAISPTTSTCHNGLLRFRRWAKMRATSQRRPAPSSAPPASQATTCAWRSMSAVCTQQKAPSTFSRRMESSGAREMREASIALKRSAEIPSRSMITLQVWPATTSFSSARILRSSADSGRTGASIVSARRGRAQPGGAVELTLQHEAEHVSPAHLGMQLVEYAARIGVQIVSAQRAHERARVLTVGVDAANDRVEIVHDLEVGLRHRLCRASRGFQRFAPGGVLTTARDPHRRVRLL